MVELQKPKLGDLRVLVGNPGVYAVQDEQGVWRPVREPMTDKVLRSHRAGDITVGTYIVNPPDQARTLVFDIDHADEAEAREMLKRLTATLIGLNRGPANGELRWFTEFSGKKGWHVWVVANDYLDAATLFTLGRGVRTEAGLPDVEVFPKQTAVRDLGNLVKLPGGIHRVTGASNDVLLGSDMTPNSPSLLVSLAAQYPTVRATSTSAPASIETPCVDAIQEGVTEGGRHMSLFHLAVMLRKASLKPEHIEHVLRDAAAKAEPPYDIDPQMEGIMAGANVSGPVCDQLPEGVRCPEDACIKRRNGLSPRTGEARWGADDQAIVVRIKERTDGGRVLELEHPDFTQARAILAEQRRGKDE